MRLGELYSYCREMMETHPEKSQEIMEFYYIAEMEVEDGESEDNECEIAVSDIENLCRG